MLTLQIVHQKSVAQLLDAKENPFESRHGCVLISEMSEMVD